MLLMPLVTVSVKIARWLASGCGSGWANVAPGTFGSVAAVVFWWIIQTGDPGIDLPLQLISTAVMIVGGWCVVVLARRGESDADPQWIVIDEWAGIFISLLFVSPTNVLHIVVAFLLFRLFDVAKPGPVGWAEKLPGALGIMADDIVAGLCAFGVLQSVLQAALW